MPGCNIGKNCFHCCMLCQLHLQHACDSASPTCSFPELSQLMTMYGSSRKYRLHACDSASPTCRFPELSQLMTMYGSSRKRCLLTQNSRRHHASVQKHLYGATLEKASFTMVIIPHVPWMGSVATSVTVHGVQNIPRHWNHLHFSTAVVTSLEPNTHLVFADYTTWLLKKCFTFPPPHQL